MPYQNDLMSLADVVSPAYAAGQGMTQEDLANQKTQLENERYAGQNPAEIARPGLQNLFTQAQTAGQQGIAQQEQAKGTEAQALLPGKIATGQAANVTQYNAQQIQQFGQLGQIAGQVASRMDNIPEAARPAEMQRMAQMYGVDPQKIGPLMDGDPAKLRLFRDQMIQGTQAWQEKQLESQTRLGVAGTEATAKTGAAEIQAGARRYASDNAVRIKQLSENIDQTIASLGRKIAAAGTNADPNDQALMKTLQQQQILARQMGASNTAYLVGQGQVAQAPTFVPTAPGQGGGQTPQQAAPQGGGGNALEAEMKRRGLL